jgi:hypothetical protein
MICYLTCLREFGQAAVAEDMAGGRIEPFKFPFPIDADKVRTMLGRGHDTVQGMPGTIYCAQTILPAEIRCNARLNGSASLVILSRVGDTTKFDYLLLQVNNYTIKLTLNSDTKWTKALKFMLANLKVALQWMVKHKMNSNAAPQLRQLNHEGPSH